MKYDHSYDDIINHPRHISKKHPQMSLYARSAQFAPFAALTGYEDAIRETARETRERIDIDEGIISIFSKHSTSAIVVNENESGLLNDLEFTLNNLNLYLLIYLINKKIKRGVYYETQ